MKATPIWTLALFVFLGFQAWHASASTIRFLHLSDTHDITESSGKQAGVSLARAAQKALDLRLAHPDEPAVFVHSGDFISPSASSRTFEGSDVVDALNASGIQVATLGNHEFDYGNVILQKRLREVDFPVVNANVRDATTLALMPGIKESVVLTISGYRVGFVGAVTMDTQATITKFGDNLKVIDPVAALKNVVSNLRASGQVDLVVGLTHLTDAEDRRVAQEVPGIDLILGGHEHRLMNEVVNGVHISKVRNDVQDLGTVQVEVERAGGKARVGSQKIESILLTREMPMEPTVAKVMEGYETRLVAKLAEVAGYLPEALDGTWAGLGAEIKTGSPKLGTFVAEQMRSQIRADIALINVGVIGRSNRIFGPGSLTLRDLEEMIPYTDPPVIIEVTGRKLRLQLERMLERAVTQSRPSESPILSGADIQWDLSLPAGSRVTRLNYQGSALPDSQAIRLMVNKYIYMSEPELTAAKLLTPLASLKTEYELMLSALSRTLQTHGTTVGGPGGFARSREAFLAGIDGGEWFKQWKASGAPGSSPELFGIAEWIESQASQGIYLADFGLHSTYWDGKKWKFDSASPHVQSGLARDEVVARYLRELPQLWAGVEAVEFRLILQSCLRRISTPF